MLAGWFSLGTQCNLKITLCPVVFQRESELFGEISRTTILDRHEHVKINGFAHVSHIDGTYTHTLLDCLYFPDQERRYEFVISTSLRRCFDGFVVWTLVVSIVEFDVTQKRRCHACTGGTWCLLRWCGPPWVLFDADRCVKTIVLVVHVDRWSTPMVRDNS